MAERLKNDSERINLAKTGWNVSAETNPDGSVNSLVLGDIRIDIPEGEFGDLTAESGTTKIIVKDFSNHPMNMGIRHTEMTDQRLVNTDQDRLLVIKTENGQTSGLVMAKNLLDDSLISRVDLLVDSTSSLPFKISLFKLEDEEVSEVCAKSPGEDAKILHATQVLGHIKDACDMQMFAHQQGTLVEKWRFAFPPTTKRSGNQSDLVKKGVPTTEVTSSWTYGPESEVLPSDFRKPESLETVMGFLAANSELCKRVAEGEFGVVSTNFKQEGNLFKLINPNIILTGINFTFLNGRPGDRIQLHEDSQKFMRMLERVQDSLDNAPKVLMELAGREVQEADWWRLTDEKLVNVDILLFRTFSFDPSLPREIGNTEIVQIPHPVPEVRLSKSESRKHIGTIIQREIPNETTIVMLPGSSEDGLFQERLSTVCDFVKGKEDIVVIMPLRPEDQRLSGKNIPSNVFTIGYRGDWMDILPGADVTFIRGSWGEILDVVASGVTPIIMSPGTVPDKAPDSVPEGDRVGHIQFLTEVSGERATNVSLFIEELNKQGVPVDMTNGLLADIVDPNSPNELGNAIAFAIQPEVGQSVRCALLKTKKDGISWMVTIHELLLANGRVPTQHEIDRLHHQIWNY